MLGWFLYFWIALYTGSLVFETSHNKSSLILILSSLATLLKKYSAFSNLDVRGTDVTVVN